MPVSEIVRTVPATNFDRTIAAKRAVRNARETHGLSRAQLSRMAGHDSERLLRAYEDEEAENKPPIDFLMHPDVPSEYVEFVFEKIREARGEQAPLGATTAADSLCALERGVGQYVTWKGAVGLAAVGAKTAAQGLRIVEAVARDATIAARFLRRAITGAHTAARGGSR